MLLHIKKYYFIVFSAFFKLFWNLRCTLLATRSKTQNRRKRQKPLNFFLTFSIPTLRFLSNTQNRKLGKRKVVKNIPRFLTFPTFQSFQFTTFHKPFEFFLIRFFSFWVGYEYPSLKHMFKVTNIKERVETVF